MERVADYVIRKVYEAGAKHIFFVSGRGILYLTDAVARNKNIIPVSTYHEQSASYAAMAYARMTGEVSACLVSTGCAATNAVTAALCAYQDNLPVIFISGNNHLDENARHTKINIRTYGSQEADIVSIVKPITKYAVMLDNPYRVAYEVEKAIYFSHTARRGPVWIDVPLDVQNMRIDENDLEHYEPSDEPNYEFGKIYGIVEELNAAKRPILLIGGGASGARKEIARFVENTRIPIVCSPVAADIFGTFNDLSIGTVGSIGGSRAGNFAVQNSDYLLCVGSKLCSQLTGKKDNFARCAKVVTVDIDELEHTKDGVSDEVVYFDAKIFLETILEAGLKKHSREWADKCIHWKDVFSVSNEPFQRKLIEEDQIDLYSLLYELDKILPDDATVITDAGLEELTVPSVLKYRNNQRCLFPAAQGAMGYALPAIIGAYEAGRRNICCVVGDGSIMMNLQELQIISSLRIPVTIVVVNNNMYAVIRKRQKDLFRTRTVGTDPSDGVPRPNFRNIAECFGFRYKLIGDRNDLIQELPSLFDDAPTIIEVICIEEQPYFHESYAFDSKRKLVRRPIEDMSPFLARELIKREMIIDPLEE